MLVIGLTGSIGMGKSTVGGLLTKLGAKICNADTIVHQLLAKDGAAVAEVDKHFPGVVKNNAVDRKALGEIVFKDKKKLKVLEKLLHPLVVAAENDFVIKQTRLGAKMVVLDIPLLFETGAEKRCDVTLVVSAPHFIQRQRVMKRPHMTEQKFTHILRSQLPDREKRKRGDFVVLTGLGKGVTFRMVSQILKRIYEYQYEDTI